MIILLKGRFFFILCHHLKIDRLYIKFDTPFISTEFAWQPCMLHLYISTFHGLDLNQVEITCRDRNLLPFFTLQYVRDTIWTSSSDAMVMIPDSPRSSVDHVMTLQYRRSSQPYQGQAHVIRHFFLR